MYPTFLSKVKMPELYLTYLSKMPEMYPAFLSKVPEMYPPSLSEVSEIYPAYLSKVPEMLMYYCYLVNASLMPWTHIFKHWFSGDCRCESPPGGGALSIWLQGWHTRCTSVFAQWLPWRLPQNHPRWWRWHSQHAQPGGIFGLVRQAEAGSKTFSSGGGWAHGHSEWSAHPQVHHGFPHGGQLACCVGVLGVNDEFDRRHASCLFYLSHWCRSQFHYFSLLSLSL